VITSDRIKIGDYTMSLLSTYPFPIFFEEWGVDIKEITNT
jgi:virginiamycin A acetyltransferase